MLTATTSAKRVFSVSRFSKLGFLQPQKMLTASPLMFNQSFMAPSIFAGSQSRRNFSAKDNTTEEAEIVSKNNANDESSSTPFDDDYFAADSKCKSNRNTVWSMSRNAGR